MFNTVAKVAGVAILGGVVLYAGYSFSTKRMEDTVQSDPLPRESTQNSNLVGDDSTNGRQGVPEGVGTVEFEEGQAGERVAVADDETSDPAADSVLPPELLEQELTEEERLVRLGEGGLVDEDGLQEDLRELVEEAADTVQSSETAHDSSVPADPTNEAEINVAGDAAIAQDKQEAEAPRRNGLRGLPTVSGEEALADLGIETYSDREAQSEAEESDQVSPVSETTPSAANEQAEEDGSHTDLVEAGQTTAPIQEAGTSLNEPGIIEPETVDESALTEGDEIADTSSEVDSTADQMVSAEQDTGPPPQDSENSIPIEDTAATESNAQSTNSTPPQSAEMTENPRQSDKPDDGKFFTENKPQVDKPDDGRYFTENQKQPDKKDDGTFYTANRKQVDKPDDGDFFTENTTGDDFNPCLKADGTVYEGPGTVLNPFADENPCLPQATDDSFDIAAEPIPQDTDTDVDLPFWQPRQPDWNTFIPIPPPDGDFGSDYRAL